MHISDDMMIAAVKAYNKVDGRCRPVAIRAALEAAISTDAEPVAWRWRSTLFAEWNLSDKPPIDQRSMEQLMELNMEGLEWQALYAEPVKTAPAVAVKADLPERFEEWWAGRDSKGEKTLDYNQRKQLAWDAFYAAALSAQVQDVAEASPAEYMRRHDAAIAAYEANTPSDSRYSALALRKAVDAAFAVAASPASKHGDAE